MKYTLIPNKSGMIVRYGSNLSTFCSYCSKHPTVVRLFDALKRKKPEAYAYKILQKYGVPKCKKECFLSFIDQKNQYNANQEERCKKNQDQADQESRHPQNNC